MTDFSYDELKRRSRNSHRWRAEYVLLSSRFRMGFFSWRSFIHRKVFAILQVRRRISTFRKSTFKFSFHHSSRANEDQEGAVFYILTHQTLASQLNCPVYAILRSVSAGHKGFSRNMMLPNSEAQMKVVWQSLEVAGLSPDEIDIVEGRSLSRSLEV